MIQHRNQKYFLCAIVFECMVYSDPKFLIFKTKNGLIYFSEDEGYFFGPMLSRKAFATNSLKYTFVWDVWFGRDCVCFKIEKSFDY